MPEPNVYILAGPVQSGKTSALLQWIAGKKEVNGIVTPGVAGKRVFREISTREEYNMEATAGESEVLEIGRFTFSQQNFERAIQHLQSIIPSNGWLIIDEIGPLELKDNGFHDILEKILAVRKDNILLVVREGLVNQVTEKYRFDPVTILTPETLTAIT